MMGVDIQGSALPAQIICPLCNTVGLRVYQDLALGGQWYDCATCGFRGDTIELAAKAWNISVESAYLVFPKKGLELPKNTLDDDIITKYAEQHVAKREKWRNFWAKVQANGTPRDSANICALQRKFGMVGHGLGRAEWLKRGGQFIGQCHRSLIEETWQPGNVARRQTIGEFDSRESRQRVSFHSVPSGKDRIFKGKGWDDVLVIPFQDMPGRFTGFLFIGRTGATPDDFVYRSCRMGPIDGTNPPFEAGVSMFTAGISAHPEFGNTTFILPFDQAIGLQLRHLAEHAIPLPIWGGWYGRYQSRDVGVSLPARNYIVCAPSADGKSLGHARRLRAKVTINPIDINRPVQELRKLEQDATRWEDVLEAELCRLPEEAGHALVATVALRPDEAVRFVEGSTQQSREHIRAFFEDVKLGKRIIHNNLTIIETDDGWINDKSGEIITNAMLRVDKVVYDDATDDSIYQGVIRYKGHDYPFVEPGKMVEDSTLKFLRKTVLKHAGEVAYVNGYWGRQFLSIAQRFHQPVCVRGIGRVGWDQERNGFVFPGFMIGGTGKIKPIGRDVIGSECPPCARFDAPDGLTPAQVVALGESNQANHVFWAVAAFVAVDALAPIMAWARPRLALVGDCAAGIGPVAAKALGCVSFIAPSGDGIGISTALAKVEKIVTAHRWPVLVERAGGGPLRHRIVDVMPAGVVATLSEWAGASTLVRGGWSIAEAWDRHDPVPIGEHGRIMADYLIDLTNRQFRLPAGLPMQVVIEDMADWFGRCGGNADAIMRANRIIKHDDHEHRAERFAELIGRIYDSGVIEVWREHLRTAPKHRDYMTLHADGRMAIPKRAINRILRQHYAPPLDPVGVTRMLNEAGVGLEDSNDGWTVEEAWWTRQLKGWRTVGLRRLRVMD